MELDSIDNYIKDNLENIMNGVWDEQFDVDQLEEVKKNVIFTKPHSY